MQPIKGKRVMNQATHPKRTFDPAPSQGEEAEILKVHHPAAGGRTIKTPPMVIPPVTTVQEGRIEVEARSVLEEGLARIKTPPAVIPPVNAMQEGRKMKTRAVPEEGPA